jgi:hypothetical protein
MKISFEKLPAIYPAILTPWSLENKYLKQGDSDDEGEGNL